MEDPHAIWEKQKDESDAAYKCFSNYLKMPKTRSLSHLSELIKKNIYIIKKWYSKYQWEERARAYDKSVSNREEDYDIKKMYRRHIEKAMKLQNLAIQKFNDIDPSTLTNSEMIRFLSAGANLEQSARKGFEQSFAAAPEKSKNYLEELKKFIND